MRYSSWYLVVLWLLLLEFCGKITESCGPLGFQPGGSSDGSQNVPAGQEPGRPGGSVCRDLSLFQRSNRGGIEQYRFFYSQTLPGNAHPALSTVSVNCLENNVAATVFAYRSDAPGRQTSRASLITSGPTITATCTVGFSGPEWTVLGKRFDEVYCGTSPPSDNFL